ncbi:MAG TPA: TetR/AcrR family transcriptional regulator [Polyangiaceae bacterium]
MRKRARMETDERRAQLLALGLSVFSSRAYDEVAMDDVAHAAGISKGLVYHYFPTKRHFYVAVLREAARQLLAETEPDPSAPPEERLRRGLSAYLAFVEKHARAYGALMRGGVGVDKQVSAVIEKTRAEFVERFFSAPELRPVLTPRLRLAVRGWIGFVEATALEWLERRELSREELLDLWTRVLFVSSSP